MKLYYVLLGSCVLWLFSCVQSTDSGEESELPDQQLNLLENGQCEKWSSVDDSHYLSGWSLRENQGCVYREEKTGVWQVFDYTIKVPVTAHFFVFEMHSYVGTTIYIDDCSVVDLGA